MSLLSLVDFSSAVQTPAVSVAAINLNAKKVARLSAPGYQPGYLDAVQAKLPNHFKSFRENCEGMPSTAGVPYNWSGTACSWVDEMVGKSFFAGGGFVFEPLGSNLMSANGWNSTGEAQVRWRLRQLIDHLGSNLDGLILPGNECDAGGGYALFSSGGATLSQAMDRMLDVARMTYEERGSSPIALLGPSLAFSNWSGGAGEFTLMDLLSRNSNQIMGYIDGLDWHPHTAACTRWHNFDGSAPIDSAYSPHHVGRVLNALGIPKPACPFESGYAWDNWDVNGLNAKYRFGSHFCALLRYATSWWSLYAHAASGHDEMNISEATPPFAKRAWYDAATLISEPTQYMRPADGQLSIVAKPSTAFNDPPWIVCAPHTGAGFPTEFSRVTITNGNIHCAAGGRNIVARPVWLPDLSARQVSVSAVVSGGAQAKLCVYGFDKLNMLAETVQSITTSGNYTVEFQPRLHGNPRIPDPNYVLVWLDHNGTGVVDWAGPAIS